jgi:four helix bundle protein
MNKKNKHRTDLIQRTKKFALGIIDLVESLPQKQTYWIIGKQLVRCATSVGANYRSACRAKSTKDFISKLSIVEEEGDEPMYWLELLSEKTHNTQISEYMKEANEIVSIIVASKKTARKNLG